MESWKHLSLLDYFPTHNRLPYVSHTALNIGDDLVKRHA
jgi:hypothetical protein